jgi:hypothetical protein
MMDEIRVLVHTQQIDSPPAILPLPELFGDYEGVGAHYFNLLSKHTLEVAALSQAGLGKSNRFHRFDGFFGQFV